MDGRDRELERLVGQQAELIEQMRRSPNRLELHIRLTYLAQQINEIEDALSLTAVLFARRAG